MIAFQCEICGEENHVEVPIEECDAEFDVTVIEGHVKLIRYPEVVQMSVADWEKVHTVWKAHHTELRRQ